MGTLQADVVYTYDVNNRLIKRRADEDGDGTFETIHHFVYDGDNIAVIFDGANTRTNLYLNGPAVDQIFADETANRELLWALSDNQGTLRDVINSDGTVPTPTARWLMSKHIMMVVHCQAHLLQPVATVGLPSRLAPAARPATAVRSRLR